MLLTMMIKVFCTLALACLLQAICRHRRPGPCTHTHAFITPHNPESLSTHCGLTDLWALLFLIHKVHHCLTNSNSKSSAKGILSLLDRDYGLLSHTLAPSRPII